MIRPWFACLPSFVSRFFSSLNSPRRLLLCDSVVSLQMASKPLHRRSAGGYGSRVRIPPIWQRIFRFCRGIGPRGPL